MGHVSLGDGQQSNSAIQIREQEVSQSTIKRNLEKGLETTVGQNVKDTRTMQAAEQWRRGPSTEQGVAGSAGACEKKKKMEKPRLSKIIYRVKEGNNADVRR